MQDNFKILTDSSCDIPDSLLEKYAIDCIPFYISFDKSTYLKERVEITLEDFYDKLANAEVLPKTSLPSMQDYINKLRPSVEKGEDVLVICLTSDFSGSYGSAVNARELLCEEFPDANITVIDSRQSTIGQGLLVLEAARMRSDGLTMNETKDKLCVLRDMVRIQITVDTLENLQKGGRIGKVGALAGSILNVKPLMVMKEGELHPCGVVRGRKKALNKIIDLLQSDIGESDYANYRYGIARVGSDVEADKLAQKLEDTCQIKLTYPHFTVGATIGTNIGPTAIGVAYMPTYDSV